jgi:hypothetical protein
MENEADSSNSTCYNNNYNRKPRRKMEAMHFSVAVSSVDGSFPPSGVRTEELSFSNFHQDASSLEILQESSVDYLDDFSPNPEPRTGEGSADKAIDDTGFALTEGHKSLSLQAEQLFSSSTNTLTGFNTETEQHLQILTAESDEPAKRKALNFSTRYFLGKSLRTWDDTVWYEAQTLLMNRFSKEAKLLIETGKQTAIKEYMLLLIRSCQERPNVEMTFEFMDEFLLLVKNILDEAIKKRNPRHERRTKDRTASVSMLAEFIYEAVETIIKYHYWVPNTSLAHKMMTYLAATANQPTAADKWLERHIQKSRFQQNRLREADRHDYTVCVQAWARSKSSDAVERAALLVRKLQKGYRGGENKHLKPTEAAYAGWIVAITNDPTKNKVTAAVEAERVLQEIWQRAPTDAFYPSVVLYNAVIHAWSRAQSAAKAEAVLVNMCQKAMTVKNTYATPDVTSFTSVISAWATSESPDAPDRAERLLLLMQEYARTSGMKSVEPNIITMTAVMNCWAKSNRVDGPAKCESILRRILQSIAGGNKILRLNTTTYNTCMNAWARSVDENAPERVEALFKNLVDYYYTTGKPRLKPDLISYMARINVWERSNKNRWDIAAKTEAILEEMIATNDPEIYPETLHFNRVISGWARCGDSVKAEALLNRMLSLYKKDGKRKCGPTCTTFNFVLSAWSQRSSEEAAENAEKMLDRMEDESRASGLNVRPNVVSYNTCMSAWARSGSEAAFHRAKLLQKRMHRTGIQLDGYSYGTLLQILSRSKKNDIDKMTEARDLVRNMEKARIPSHESIVRYASNCGVNIDTKT